MTICILLESFRRSHKSRKISARFLGVFFRKTPVFYRSSVKTSDLGQTHRFVRMILAVEAVICFLVPFICLAFVVPAVRQLLTLKMYNFIALFAYKVDPVGVTHIVNCLLFTCLIVCTYVVHVRRWKKAINIFHDHLSLGLFEKLISASRAPKRQGNLTFKFPSI